MIEEIIKRNLPQGLSYYVDKDRYGRKGVIFKGCKSHTYCDAEFIEEIFSKEEYLRDYLRYLARVLR